MFKRVYSMMSLKSMSNSLFNDVIQIYYCLLVVLECAIWLSNNNVHRKMIRSYRRHRVCEIIQTVLY